MSIREVIEKFAFRAIEARRSLMLLQTNALDQYKMDHDEVPFQFMDVAFLFLCF